MPDSVVVPLDHWNRIRRVVLLWDGDGVEFSIVAADDLAIRFAAVQGEERVEDRHSSAGWRWTQEQNSLQSL